MRNLTTEEQKLLRPMVDALDDLDEQLAICQARWRRQVKRLQVACGVGSDTHLDPTTLQWVRVEKGPNGSRVVPLKDLG